MTTDTNTAALPSGQIGGLAISRVMLGGDLLSHYHYSCDQHGVFKLVATNIFLSQQRRQP